MSELCGKRKEGEREGCLLDAGHSGDCEGWGWHGVPEGEAQPLALILKGLNELLLATGGRFIGDDLKWLEDVVGKANKEYLRLLGEVRRLREAEKEAEKQAEPPVSGTNGVRKPYEPPAVATSSAAVESLLRMAWQLLSSSKAYLPEGPLRRDVMEYVAIPPVVPEAMIRLRDALGLLGSVRPRLAKDGMLRDGVEDAIARIGALVSLKNPTYRCPECKKPSGEAHAEDCGRNPWRQARRFAKLPDSEGGVESYPEELRKGVAVFDGQYRFYVKNGVPWVFVQRGEEREWASIDRGVNAVLAMMMDLLQERRLMNEARKALGVYV